jgi:hypothetical protein
MHPPCYRNTEGKHRCAMFQSSISKTPFLFDARDQLFCFEPIIQIVAILSLTCFIQPAGQRLHL